MRTIFTTLSIIAAIALLGPASHAQETLGVGDKAPKLVVDEWVKGKEIKSFEKGKVYVVEFWATWCPPCRTSIPKLTAMQKQYGKDKLAIIGVAGSEREGKDHLKSFVEKQGDKMDYHVAYDGHRRAVRTWMTPAGKGSLPTAFIVDGSGKIAWIGNPHRGLDTALKKVMGDTAE